jgi:hypothetical protein
VTGFGSEVGRLSSIPALGRVTPGVVNEFDVDSGLGTVVTSDGVTVPFHCTAITNGSRDIAVHTTVAFILEPAHLGRVEARQIQPC